jgi:DNA-binding MurR/RpiR family transcriptional regulator
VATDDTAGLREWLAFLGTVDLAERVGVSQASVTRSAFALGFEC